MTSEQLLELFKVVSYVAGAVILGIKSIDSAKEYLINRDKQKSVGAEAVKRMDDRIDHLEERIVKLTDEAEKLNKAFNDLMEKFWKYITK